MSEAVMEQVEAIVRKAVHQGSEKAADRAVAAIRALLAEAES